jgi:UDP-N-acetylglucosamine 4,6-dehydratase/5-epimerase
MAVPMPQFPNIMVTGATGAFGTAFIKRLLTALQPSPERIVIYSRGEFRQFQMAQELKTLDKGRLRFLIGDVRDRDRLRRAMQGIGIVVHAAALKRIEVGNYNPIEVVKTNVDGAVNVIEAAQDAGIKKVVALSSDKAFEPVSPYGTSKALAESIFIAANNTTGWVGPKFSVCRYGNVWNSTGSVVPVWRQFITNGLSRVPVTDPDCTRFFMRMAQAVDLVLNTIQTMKGGEIQIPTLPAYRLGDLALAMGVEMDISGLPSWEKKHESMCAGNSSDKARRMTVEELKEELP